MSTGKVKSSLTSNTCLIGVWSGKERVEQEKILN